LAGRGHEVVIYTTDVFNRRPAKQPTLVVETMGFKVYEFSSIGAYPLTVSTAFARAIRANVEQFDVVHINEYRTFIGTVTSHYAAKRKIPYIIQAHGALSTKIGRLYLKQLHDRTIGERMLRAAASTIAISAKEADDYRRMGVASNRIVIMPHGIEFSEYRDLPPRGEFKRLNDIPENSPLVSYVGRLDRTKGLSLLVTAFAGVLQHISEARLALIGRDYGSEAGLRGLAQDLKIENRILFTGFVSKDDKRRAYVDSDAVVTPSYNGFPRTFLEAGACGTPILTTRNGDWLDWIDGQAGLVVDYSAEELKRGILTLVRDKPLRQRLRIQARRTVEQRFDWGIVSRQFEDLYAHVVSAAHFEES